MAPSYVSTSTSSGSEHIDLGHTPVSIASERQSAAAPNLRGIWVVNDDGTVLHIDA